jgi:hypothetical protein
MDSKTFDYQCIQVCKNYLYLLANFMHFKIIGVSCLSLQELPTSINQLNALQKLNLHNCFRLQELPTFIDQLSAL